MQTEAIFEKIEERILEEIGKVEKSIYILIPSLTNSKIFDELVVKANNGCSVNVLITDNRINEHSSIDFSRLQTGNSRVQIIENGDNALTDEMFFVIDHNTVITGSYNWNHISARSHANAVITMGDTLLTEQFITEFNRIRKKYISNATKAELDFPLDNIIKRLEILKNYISLEDTAELRNESAKLRKYDFNSAVQEIADDIQHEKFASALSRIEIFLSKNQKLAVWTDPEITGLKLEIKNLENQLNAFDNEKSELVKLLSEFQHQHTIELGEIILEILHLRKLKFKTNEESYVEAEKDEQQYRKQVDSERENEIFNLTDDQKSEIKKKFRKATILCHPDKFANESIEVQKQSEDIFKELNEANSKNDIKAVSEILEFLEKGILVTIERDKLKDKDLLRATVIKLQGKVETLQAEIIAIKESEEYSTVIQIEDWEIYFEEVKSKLLNELESLKLEIQ